MKAGTWLAGIVVVAALGYLAWQWTIDAPSPDTIPAAGPAAEAPPPPPPAAGPSPEARAATDAGARPDGRRPGEALLMAITDQHRFDPTDPDNAATSEADADWLHRAGFPDPAAYQMLRNASIEDLEAAAKTDLRAQVILAFNMAVAGGYGDQPFALLEDAAVRGSVFALATWGDIHYTVEGYRNPALGNAYYRLAYRRGYFTAATTNYSFASALDGEARLYADVYSEAAWSRLQALRQQRGLQPYRDTELRPGFQAFLAQIEAGLRQQQQQAED